jgi:starch-binding outer membrane protein, SusD/RagB family
MKQLYQGKRKWMVLVLMAVKWLQEAANAADQLIKSGQYRLHHTGVPGKDYRSLFISENALSTEVLLAAVYNKSLKRWHNAAWWFKSATLGARLGLSNSFVNTYLNIDGTSFTSRPGYDMLYFPSEVKNRDKRLQQNPAVSVAENNFQVQ